MTPILLCSGGVKILLSQWCDRLSLIGCESEALELAPRTTSLASSLALLPSTSHPDMIFTPWKRYPQSTTFHTFIPKIKKCIAKWVKILKKILTIFFFKISNWFQITFLLFFQIQLVKYGLTSYASEPSNWIFIICM